MAFNPFTDLFVEQNNESIEDVPKVNIELELLPVLRRTTLKTKQVAETIKSGNRFLRNDLERITNLRRRLLRTIPVIPRLLGTAGSIFGEGIDRDPPMVLPFLLPTVGGTPLKEDTKKEESKVPVPVEQKQKEKELELVKDKSAVRANIKELIALGSKEALEEARRLAEEAGILSEFPELQTKKDNQEEKLKTLNLADIVKIVIENQKEQEKAIPLSVTVDGRSFSIDINQQLAKVESSDGTIFDTNTPKFEFQRVIKNTYLGPTFENKMINIQNEPPSAFVYLLAENMLKQAKETNQVQEGMTENEYIIRAFPSGQIYISSPGFRIEGAKNIGNNKGLKFLQFSAAIFDLYPGNFKSKNLSSTQKTQRLIKNLKTIKLTNKGKISYSNFNQRTKIRIRNLNKNKFFDIKTRKRLEDLLNKKFASDELLRRINQDKDIMKVITDLDGHFEILSRALRIGEVPDGVSNADFRRAVRAFEDVMVDMLQDGGMSKTDLDTIIRDLRTLNNFDIDTIFQNDPDKPVKNDALVDKMNRIFNFGVFDDFKPVGGDKDLSSLRIDTGNDTLIVLLNSDAAIPTFG